MKSFQTAAPVLCALVAVQVYVHYSGLQPLPYVDTSSLFSFLFSSCFLSFWISFFSLFLGFAGLEVLERGGVSLQRELYTAVKRRLHERLNLQSTSRACTFAHRGFSSSSQTNCDRLELSVCLQQKEEERLGWRRILLFLLFVVFHLSFASRISRISPLSLFFLRLLSYLFHVSLSLFLSLFVSQHICLHFPNYFSICTLSLIYLSSFFLSTCLSNFIHLPLCLSLVYLSILFCVEVFLEL